MNILQMSVSASILILVIAAIRSFAINKLPKATFLALWGIAIIVLLNPFPISSRFSVYNVLQSVGSILAQSSEESSGGGNKSVSVYHVIQNPVADSPWRLEGLTLLWLAGAVVAAVFFGTAYYRSLRKIQAALPLKGNKTIDKWAAEQKIFRPVRIMVSDQITTPLACGVFKPRIIFPKFMDFDNERQLEYILTHELVHIKRLDTLWKFLLLIVLCLHWFNPLVWVLYVLMNRDLELACDEKVIKLLGENVRSTYALSLIRMAEQRGYHAPLYNGFSKNAAEERIVSIMKFKKATIFTTCTALLLLVGVTSAFATMGKDTNSVDFSTTTELSAKVDQSGNLALKDGGESVDSSATTELGSKVDQSGNLALKDGGESVVSSTTTESSAKVDQSGNLALKDGGESVDSSATAVLSTGH